MIHFRFQNVSFTVNIFLILVGRRHSSKMFSVEIVMDTKKLHAEINRISDRFFSHGLNGSDVSFLPELALQFNSCDNVHDKSRAFP